jgi:hypothetical protein
MFLKLGFGYTVKHFSAFNASSHLGFIPKNISYNIVPIQKKSVVYSEGSGYFR